MFELPWLQDNIWQNFLKFNYTYLSTRPWLFYLGVVALVLAVSMIFLRNCLSNKKLYADCFSDKIYVFDYKKASDWVALVAVIAAIIFTEVYILTLENSLFENYDLMAINTTRSMRFGLVASFDYIRVIPLGSWYLSSLYAITQNIIVIKIFVLFQTMLVAWALAVFFNYIPVAKKLWMIAILLVMPTLLQTANIIFPERDMIIALMLGLIFARKYCRTHQLKWAAFFILFANIAIYTKETCIIFYSGIVLTSLIYNVITEKIVMKSLLKPWRIIQIMPIEFLLALSLLCYVVIFEILQNGANFYLSANKQTLLQQLVSYRLELILMAVAVGIAVYRLIKFYSEKNNPMFRSGLLVGAICTAVAIVVIFRLSPSTPHLAGKSYYMLTSTLFVLAYLFEYIDNKKLLGVLGVLLIVYSVQTDMMFHRQNKGVYYREVAEYMADHTKPKTVNPVFILEGPYVTKTLWQWIIETWSTAYRYYFNDRIFVIKSDVHYLDRNITQKLKIFNNIPLIYFPLVPKPLPEKGDWLVINKENKSTKAINLRQAYKNNLVYENALFEIYMPK